MILLGAFLLTLVLVKVRWFTMADTRQLAGIARNGFIGMAALALFCLLLSGRLAVFLIGVLALLPFFPSISGLWNQNPDFPPEANDLRSDNASLTHAQALEILGLQEGATQKEIQTAHRRIIQKIHPDKGGSGFLAAQVNRAKDTLLTDDKK